MNRDLYFIPILTRALQQPRAVEALGAAFAQVLTQRPGLPAALYFLATGAYRAGEPSLDPFERIVVELLSPGDAGKALRDATVHHGLVLAAFGLYFAAGYHLS